MQIAKTNLPMTDNKLAASVNPDEDIPAVDADVKDSDAVGQKEVEAKEKVPEPRKDPREDPIGWVNSLIPGAVHKVSASFIAQKRTNYLPICKGQLLDTVEFLDFLNF